MIPWLEFIYHKQKGSCTSSQDHVTESSPTRSWNIPLAWIQRRRLLLQEVLVKSSSCQAFRFSLYLAISLSCNWFCNLSFNTSPWLPVSRGNAEDVGLNRSLFLLVTSSVQTTRSARLTAANTVYLHYNFNAGPVTVLTRCDQNQAFI